MHFCRCSCGPWIDEKWFQQCASKTPDEFPSYFARLRISESLEISQCLLLTSRTVSMNSHSLEDQSTLTTCLLVFETTKPNNQPTNQPTNRNQFPGTQKKNFINNRPQIKRRKPDRQSEKNNPKLKTLSKNNQKTLFIKKLCKTPSGPRGFVTAVGAHCPEVHSAALAKRRTGEVGRLGWVFFGGFGCFSGSFSSPQDQFTCTQTHKCVCFGT